MNVPVSERPAKISFAVVHFAAGEQIRHRSNSKHEREGGYPNHPNSLRWCGKSVYTAPLDFKGIGELEIILLPHAGAHESSLQYVYAQPGLVLGSFSSPDNAEAVGQRCNMYWVSLRKLCLLWCKVEGCLGLS